MTAKTCYTLLCFFACALLSSLSAVSADQAVKPPTSTGPVSGLHIRWDGIMGEDKRTPNEVYCLMGSGFVMAPTSRGINKLISHWLAKHPHVTSVRVATSGPLMIDQPNSVQTYVWVADGRNTLNEYLVRRGACPGGTMLVPDFSNLAPKSGRAGGAPFHFKTYVSPQDYNRFLSRIEQAELLAQKEKLGIWKNGTDGVY